ncbi:MAG: hypothetical protein O3C28_09320 [Proteobacteria bacterium]|nr:hypothetical protein [Pseudomonadota bacterium]
MQDIKNLDGRGIPGGLIASEVFINAAHAQADSLGFQPRGLFVAHPIQDRTDDEMRALAEAAFADVCALVCESAT